MWQTFWEKLHFLPMPQLWRQSIAASSQSILPSLLKICCTVKLLATWQIWCIIVLDTTLGLPSSRRLLANHPPRCWCRMVLLLILGLWVTRRNTSNTTTTLTRKWLQLPSILPVVLRSKRLAIQIAYFIHMGWVLLQDILFQNGTWFQIWIQIYFVHQLHSLPIQLELLSVLRQNKCVSWIHRVMSHQLLKISIWH